MDDRQTKIKAAEATLCKYPPSHNLRDLASSLLVLHDLDRTTAIRLIGTHTGKSDTHIESAIVAAESKEGKRFTITESESEKRFTFIDSPDFATGDYRPEWLVEGVLVKGQPCGIGGPAKGLKTNISVDLCLSLATGTPFLGTFKVPAPVNVAIMSGESGPSTLQETAKRICRAKELRLSELPAGRLQWCFNLPILSDLVAISEITDDLKAKGAQVLLLDPLYLMLGEVNEKSMFDVGNVLRNISIIVAKAGITPIILHHATKKLEVGAAMEIYHLAYSGFDQFCRQFILVNRRTEYKRDGRHSLLMNVGGSAGHGGRYRVDIEEGLTDANFHGRRWEVSVIDASEAEAKKADDRDEKKRAETLAKIGRKKSQVLDAIDLLTSEGQVPTKNAIQGKTGIGWQDIGKSIELLQGEKTIEEYEAVVLTGNGKHQSCGGYRRPVERVQTPELPIDDNGPMALKADDSSARRAVPVQHGPNGPTDSLPCRGESGAIGPLHSGSEEKTNPPQVEKTKPKGRRGKGGKSSSASKPIVAPDGVDTSAIFR